MCAAARKPAKKATSAKTKKPAKPAKKPVATKAKKSAPTKAKKPVAAKPKPKAKAKANAKAKAKAKPKAPAKPARAAAGKKPGADGPESHPKFRLLTSKLRAGRHAGGLLLFTEPGALDPEMGEWLMGNVRGRRSLGRTAFGDIVIFRDLRERAADLGLPGADEACDVAMIDVHYKRMAMLADTVEGFLESIDKPEWQRDFLRRDVYVAARDRIGDYAEHECFGFVPALALGGSEAAESVERGDWRVHLAILRQA